MSTQPALLDPEANEPTQAEAIRMAALNYASFLSSKETPIRDFLKTAKYIEDYIINGTVPRKIDPSVDPNSI